ncbi:MAG: hypothetical protein QF465_15335, partial [SAR202 cluster bacterium]|nr:hypothetical protein [SAR202 cluster bacterium]
SAVSQSVEQRDPFRRLERSAGTDPGETEGGSDPNDKATTIVQSSTQRARDISSKSLLTICPVSADSQHTQSAVPEHENMSAAVYDFTAKGLVS